MRNKIMKTTTVDLENKRITIQISNTITEQIDAIGTKNMVVGGIVTDLNGKFTSHLPFVLGKQPHLDFLARIAEAESPEEIQDEIESA